MPSPESAESLESKAHSALARAKECLEANDPAVLAEGLDLLKRTGDEVVASGDASLTRTYREMCILYDKILDTIDIGTSDEEKFTRWNTVIDHLAQQDNATLAIYFLNGLRNRAQRLEMPEKLQEYTQRVQSLGGELEIFPQKKIEVSAQSPQQENPYLATHSAEVAGYLWNLDKTMVSVNDGSASPEDLDDIAHDFLLQDLDRAELEKDKQGMDEVIERIKNAIRQVEEKISSLQ
ncbi:MAG: hypothetical protein JWN50_35 [Parcubacteria group bacterium]|nr:hypothetical protein [Parcubacteria group bacterium]